MVRSFAKCVLALTTTLMMMLAGCSSQTIDSPQAAPAVPQPSEIEIFFSTDRAPTLEGDGYFSPTRGDVSFGVATVAIPASHLLGKHEQPSLLKLEWTPDERKHIKIRDVKPLTREEMRLQLELALEGTPNAKVLIFVHGYNASFVKVTQLIAQFTADLKFTGPVVVFSWPSNGGVTSYVTDETNAEWATEHFVDLLKMMLGDVSAESVYLVGHSMGCRILARAVTTLASDRPQSYLARFREIIMIAPDIDADVFRREIAPRIARTGIHTTLYASSSDRALKASKLFHGYPRAGDAGDALVVVEGVETIDASDTEGGLLGHSYFAEDRRIMEDIFALLQTGQRADARFNLGAVDVGGKRHWRFRQ